MEEYKAVNQDDSELDGFTLDPHTQRKPRHSRSSYLWFASGFLAAVVITLISALSYKVVSKRAAPNGLIPDCKCRVQPYS